jgi:hypothetical protein
MGPLLILCLGTLLVAFATGCPPKPRIFQSTTDETTAKINVGADIDASVAATADAREKLLKATGDVELKRKIEQTYKQVDDINEQSRLFLEASFFAYEAGLKAARSRDERLALNRGFREDTVKVSELLIEVRKVNDAAKRTLQEGVSRESVNELAQKASAVVEQGKKAGITEADAEARTKYDEQMAKHEAELEILKKTYTVWAGKEPARGPNTRYTDLVGDRSPDYCYRNENHVHGVVTRYGGDPPRPHNINFLVRKGDGSGSREVGPCFNDWGKDGPGRRDEISNRDLVINRVNKHFQGKDFDGWTFGVTGGGEINARLAGGPAGDYPMPALPPGFEWELSAVKVDGGAWMNGAEFTFRVCFADRDRKLTPAPKPAT